MSGFLHDTWQSRQKDEWLTPPHILKALGPFDLDPCAPISRPWDTARQHFTIKDNGLIKPWNHGRIFCNPPYGRQTPLWLSKMKHHGNGIALVFARIETRWFADHVWKDADAILFLRGRLAFFHVDGTPGGSAGCGSCLIAYGRQNVRALLASRLDGVLITKRQLIKNEPCKCRTEVAPHE